MLFVSALTLLGVFRLAERVANWKVAATSALCTALYPVFFAQSSLAHLDMGVAALTVWGLVLYLPHDEKGNLRRWSSIALFALAALAKETAILVPLTLFGWEVLCLLAERRPKLAAAVCVKEGRSFKRAFMLLPALL